MAGKYSREHWERVAQIYEADAGSPAVAISERFSVPRPTARRWIRHLRREGLIRGTSHGRTAEQHDRITRIAFDLKVERCELAQIILRHIPNGKLYIHSQDAVGDDGA
jgi:transposase